MVDPLSYFSFHDWCNKGRGMCYPVCGIVCFMLSNNDEDVDDDDDVVRYQTHHAIFFKMEM